jgi:hypothetical protein
MILHDAVFIHCCRPGSSVIINGKKFLLSIIMSLQLSKTRQNARRASFV